MMIILRNVGLSFKNGLVTQAVFRKLNVEIPTDAHLAVLGWHGDGKSALVNMLSGLIQPTTGTIERRARISFPIGYARGLKPYLSARQNVVHVARLYGADVEEVSEFVLRTTEMGENFYIPMRLTSIQTRLRFCYVLSYAIPFDTYLIDGNIAYGDPEFRKLCFAMFESRAASSGFILTTRDPRIARRHCKMGAVVGGQTIQLYNNVEEAIEVFTERANARFSTAG